MPSPATIGACGLASLRHVPTLCCVTRNTSDPPERLRWCGANGGVRDVHIPSGRAIQGLAVGETRAAIPPHFSVLWAVAVVGGILYGSLLPFQFDWSVFQVGPGLLIDQLSWAPTTIEDIGTNIVVYLPLGLAVIWCGLARRANPVARIVIASCLGALLSVAAETLQTGLHARVASLTDVLLNVLGTMLGALFAVMFGATFLTAPQRLREALASRPFATTAWLLTIGLMLYGLAPLNFVTNTAELHESFRHARWSLTTPRPIDLADPPFRALVHEISGAAWFALLAFVMTFRHREARRSPVSASVSAIMHGVTLAMLVELLQLFSRVHTFDIASFVLRSSMVLFGAWCAILAWRFTALTSREERLGEQIRLAVLAVLAAFQIVIILLFTLRPAMLSLNTEALGPIGWIPFEALWHRPFSVAVAEALQAVAAFGALSLTLGMALRYARFGSPWALAGLVVVGVAGCVELIGYFTAGHTGDATGPVLALVAVIVSRIAYASLFPSALPVPADRPASPSLL